MPSDARRCNWSVRDVFLYRPHKQQLSVESNSCLAAASDSTGELSRELVHAGPRESFPKNASSGENGQPRGSTVVRVFYSSPPSPDRYIAVDEGGVVSTVG